MIDSVYFAPFSINHLHHHLSSSYCLYLKIDFSPRKSIATHHCYYRIISPILPFSFASVPLPNQQPQRDPGKISKDAKAKISKI